MTNNQNLWVPLGEAYPLVVQAYSERMLDTSLAESAALDQIVHRLADGGLCARSTGFSYAEIVHGRSMMDEDQPPRSLASLKEDGCIPVAFWQDFVASNYKQHEMHAGDFSFSLGREDFTGTIEGRASDVAVNWDGLPIIGRQPPPAAYAPAFEMGGDDERPAKSRGGRTEKYDKAHALIFLAAKAHNETLKDDNGELTVAHLANLLEEAFASEREEDQPGRTWVEGLARRVRDEIKRQKP